jgi:hypothetical protein
MNRAPQAYAAGVLLLALASWLSPQLAHARQNASPPTFGGTASRSSATTGARMNGPAGGTGRSRWGAGSDSFQLPVQRNGIWRDGLAPATASAPLSGATQAVPSQANLFPRSGGVTAARSTSRPGISRGPALSGIARLPNRSSNSHPAFAASGRGHAPGVKSGPARFPSRAGAQVRGFSRSRGKANSLLAGQLPPRSLGKQRLGSSSLGNLANTRFGTTSLEMIP